MRLFGEIIMCLCGMANDFYMIASINILTHCLYCEEMVWNRKKKWMLVFLAVVGGCTDIFWEGQAWSFWVVHVLFLVVSVYGCGRKALGRCLWGLFVTFCAGMCVFMICDIGGYYIIPGYRFPPPDGVQWNKEDIILTLETLAVFAFVYYYFLLCHMKKGVCASFGRKERRLVVIYCLYVFVVYAMTAVSVGESSDWSAVIQAAMAVILVVFGLGFPVFIFKNWMGGYYREVQEYQEVILQAELDYFRQYRNAQEETRRFRHDIRNNLLCLHTLLSGRKMDEAGEYLEGLLNDVQALSSAVVTGDEILDCILAAKLNRMQQEEISFALDGVLDHGLHWRPIDTCSVFANALDNAIEACAAIPDGQKREIRMWLKHTQQFYLIEITNTVNGDVQCERLLNPGMAFTSKEDKSLHGFGLSNVQRVVEKYGGLLKIDCQNHVFSLSLTIARQSEP